MRHGETYLIALRSPLQRATPMVEPVMHIVVDTGNPYCDARMTVIAEPSSIEKPRDGEWSVILLPRTRMMLSVFPGSSVSGSVLLIRRRR